LKRLGELKIDRIEMGEDDLLGRFAAKDLADPNTGEVILRLEPAGDRGSADKTQGRRGK
jgi:hypothetical protein